jgi:hypothetical protein
MNDALAVAQAEHTAALRAWLSARGADEPPALARLDQARARVRDLFEDEVNAWNR